MPYGVLGETHGTLASIASLLWLGGAGCLLPWPSAAYLRIDVTTPSATRRLANSSSTAAIPG